MSALPRPDVAGPVKSLNDALHYLHHRAGWPSLRTMARETGVSHTTVSKAFSAPTLPSWGIVELLVESLGGDRAEFHHLWLLASTSGNSAAARSVPRIAGRSAEVAAVERHLRSGAGLLLLCGEAGIGKSKVAITAAAQCRDSSVVFGHCLPLSTQVPLMPIAGLLRAIHDADAGQALDRVLSALPSYVRQSLSGLLPEVAEGELSRHESDELVRQRLPAALSACFEELRSTAGLALVIEDLHWADTATLDNLEHFLVRGLDVPIVGTWRLDDPETGDAQNAWRLRVERLARVETLELAPLNRDETAEQCQLLGLNMHAAAVDAIHRRSGGQPMFTEQLAVHSGDATEDLPAVLTAVLDRNLDQLDEPGHRVARALAVADRGLPLPILASVTGLAVPDLVDVLRDLTRRHLLARSDGSSQAQLKHPLLAEAARRRLVAGEAAIVHRQLAELMGDQPGADAAEVAEHWRGAGDRERELEWDVTAARAANARWASRQEAEQWIRALELWPPSTPRLGQPGLTRAQAYLAAMDALMHSLQYDRATAMSDEAAVEFPDAEPEQRAGFLRRAALFRGERDGPEAGLALVDEAIRLLTPIPTGVGMVEAMVRKHQLLLKAGRYAEARAVARETADAAEAAGEQWMLRVALGRVAWHEGVTRGLQHGWAIMNRARTLTPSPGDPLGDVWLAVIWTDVLLVLGAPADEVQAVGRDALNLAEEHGIEDFGPVLVRYNVTSALIRDGRLDEAADTLGHEGTGELDLDRRPLFHARALLEALNGRLDAATHLIEALWRDRADMQSDLEYVFTTALVELWNNQPEEAWLRIEEALANQATATPAALLWPALVVAARAAADLAELNAAERTPLATRLIDLKNRIGPAGPPPSGWVTAKALNHTWSAEVGRLQGTERVRDWSDTAAEWNKLDRPHDAAYCRWRAARVALRDTQGTVAARLLRQAATDACGHAPLLNAISAVQSN